MGNNDSQKFLRQVEEIYQKALEAAIDLLKANGDKRYIGKPDCEDLFDADSIDGVPLSVLGVGLNEKDHICIKAIVDDIGYGYDGSEYPKDWADITEDTIRASAFPELYRFVSDNLDAAMDKEAVDNLAWDDYEND